MQRIFVWAGVDEHGQNLTGTLPAPNIRFAKVLLQNQGIEVQRITRSYWFLNFHFYQLVSFQDITFFVQHLVVLLKAGMPLLKSLEILQYHNKKVMFQKCLASLKTFIQAGYPLSFALSQYPRYFDVMTCQLLQAGEYAGQVEQTLEYVVLQREKMIQFKRRLKKVLFYPITVLSLALCVMLFLFLFVIPHFAVFFDHLQVPLPQLTRTVMMISQHLPHIVLWFLLCCCVIITSIVLMGHFSETFSLWRDRLVFKIPGYGDILQKIIFERLSRMLNLALISGVPLLSALHGVEKIFQNKIFECALQDIQRDVQSGESIASALKHTGVFPHFVIQMVAIGEESGQLVFILDKIANFYAIEVEYQLEHRVQLLEIGVMILLGIIISCLMLALYLPVFKLGMVM